MSSSMLEKLAPLNAFLVKMPKKTSTKVELRGRRRSIMEGDLGMAFEPFVAFLMDEEIVY